MGYRLWLGGATPALITDPIAQCLVLIVVTSAVFLLVPGIDLWFSGLFYDPTFGFPMSQLAAFTGLRAIGRLSTVLIPVVVVLAVLVKVALPWRPSLISPRAALYILSTLAVGPGILVDLVFKDHWGRPRPFMVDAFHGNDPFVGVWQITHYCVSYCSFVSGEGSTAIWLLTLIVLVPVQRRSLAVKVLVGLAIALSLNRIAFGGHFLSDVLLAWWMTLAVMAVAYRIIYVNPPAMLREGNLDAMLGRSGLAIRQAFSRTPG